MADFFIIVPTFNAEGYLERCLASIVLTQPGQFGLRIHIQDGGSTDRTAEIAKVWAPRGVTFSSERDDGLYDAINRGASRLRPNEIMTWIGADDFLLPGTLATVASIFDQHQDVDWLTGLPFVGDEQYGNCTAWAPMLINRAELAAGLHDGRSLGFIMQEGTFWREELWSKVSGLDARYQYAGDWDLWRRFAQQATLYSLTFPLARFTKRAGQKSANLVAYYQEIDGAEKMPPIADATTYQLFRSVGQIEWRVERVPAPDSTMNTKEVADSRIPIRWRRFQNIFRRERQKI